MTDPTTELAAAREREDWIAAAQICEGALDDRAQAIACWQRALERDPSAIEALEGLERLFRAEQRWTELAAVLERHAELAAGDEQLVPVLHALLGLHRYQLADHHRAGELERLIADLTGEATR